MTIEELAEEFGVEVREVRKAITANGFAISEVSENSKHLIELYLDYLKAETEASEMRDAFKYQDGEEQVDKSKVYENYRKHYMDLYDKWQRAKQDFLDSRSKDEGSSFHLRKRAEFLDAKPYNIRRASRRGYSRRW